MVSDIFRKAQLYDPESHLNVYTYEIVKETNLEAESDREIAKEAHDTQWLDVDWIGFKSFQFQANCDLCP